MTKEKDQAKPGPSAEELKKASADFDKAIRRAAGYGPRNEEEGSDGELTMDQRIRKAAGRRGG